MALHTWGGQAAPQLNECTVIIASDGSVTAQSSTQDLGTGSAHRARPSSCAEILGLEPNDITVRDRRQHLRPFDRLRRQHHLPVAGAGHSRGAATAARRPVFEKIAKQLNAKPEDLDIEPGRQVLDKASNKTYDMEAKPAPAGHGAGQGLGRLDRGGLGQGREQECFQAAASAACRSPRSWSTPRPAWSDCQAMYAVQDCGLIINKLACESQVAGGVIMGVNYALFEERIMDRVTGRQVNPDMEFYKLGGIDDMPQIVVHMMDMPERGVIGIGEPPTISTHAAIGNAIFNAIGVRVPHDPVHARPRPGRPRRRKEGRA